jgi:hypothetical protein
MLGLFLLDIPPDPSRPGSLLSVIAIVVSLLVLLFAGLVVLLWYRKRSLRSVEMIRSNILVELSPRRGAGRSST